MKSFYKEKSVLVTGHTGFKGGWMSVWLHSMGARVSGLSLNPEAGPSLFPAVEGCFEEDIRGDIRDLAVVERAIGKIRPDLVFHLAAQPIVRISYAEPLETLATNVMGTAHVLDAVRRQQPNCHCVVVTSDKCYENQSWDYAYRESDHLGGHDVYSASKGAAEIVASSWRRSFFESAQVPGRVATARGGNVIGGGDFAVNRIVPDAARAFSEGLPLKIRNPYATRPWQHVLDCLCGYLTLGAWLDSSCAAEAPRERAFNFGPDHSSERSVEALITEFVNGWPGSWENLSDPNAPHEADRLRIATDKAAAVLDWTPQWGFERTISETVRWYRAWAEGAGASDLRSLMEEQIKQFCEDSAIIQ